MTSHFNGAYVVVVLKFYHNLNQWCIKQCRIRTWIGEFVTHWTDHNVRCETKFEKNNSLLLLLFPISLNIVSLDCIEQFTPQKQKYNLVTSISNCIELTVTNHSNTG